METNLDLNKVLTDALVVLIPMAVAWATAKLNGLKAQADIKKAQTDIDAAFQKGRALEQHLGIETKLVGGVVNVASRVASTPISANPAAIRPEGGG